MSTPSNADRVKASKLRKKRDAGKELRPEERIWLADYEASRAARASSKPDPRITPTARPLLEERNTGGFVHETKPAEAVNVSDGGWLPTVAPAPEGEQPPAEPGHGVPPPPKEGTPLVDDTPPEGDPAAAKQFALFVTFVTGMGMEAASELLADADMPAPVREMLGSDVMRKATLETVAQASERVAMKYGFGGVPMPDEAVVAVALVGSGLLVFKNERRKKLAEGKRTPTQQEAARVDEEAHEVAAEEDEFTRLLSKRPGGGQ